MAEKKKEGRNKEEYRAKTEKDEREKRIKKNNSRGLTGERNAGGTGRWYSIWEKDQKEAQQREQRADHFSQEQETLGKESEEAWVGFQHRGGQSQQKQMPKVFPQNCVN